jgi:hypothetical protein
MIQTARLLDINVLSHNLLLTYQVMKSIKGYNDTRRSNTPAGFRLQNDIVGGELFTILDADIDITTGKTKLTLLNK